MENAHAKSTVELLALLDVDAEKGLTETAAQERLASFGPNELPKEKPKSLLLLFLKQFNSTLHFILFAAAAVSFVTGQRSDAYGILIAILIDAVVGFIQERKAEEAIGKLKDLMRPEAAVWRDGRATRIPAGEVVPGDILMLTEGDRVAADARLIEGKELSTDEASLTGESAPVPKTINAIAADAEVHDRTDMVFMGTAVVSGVGRAVVAGTGVRTELGKIAASLKEIRRPRTPFESRIDALGRSFAIVTVVLAAIVFVFGLLRGHPPVDMFFFAVATIVAVIPEGLPTVLAVVLAFAVRRMAKRNAIIRQLPSVETLGAADVICTDKTGTLTENKMTVREIALVGKDIGVTGEGWEPKGEFRSGGRVLLPGEKRDLDPLCEAVVLCNRASVEWRGEQATAVGDPTEAALLVLGAKAGFDRRALADVHRFIDEIPFTSLRRYRSVLVGHHDGGSESRELFVVGAYDAVVPKCSGVYAEGENRQFDDAAHTRFKSANASMAGRALRILAVAAKKMPENQESVSEADVAGLTLIGLVGMIDPPRPGAAGALAKCRRAGIRVIMITGDQKATALAIGKEIGLIGKDVGPDDRRVMVETEAATMDERTFRARLRDAVIFARVTPQTKLRIVTALTEMGHTVAMTGDGVNDAPALKKAAIGIAMGLGGTEVAREAADMVLADDDFVSIVNAVEEGRTVFRTVKQTTAYLFMTNVGEVVTIMFSLIAGFPLPLLPAQVLWMNLVTDGVTDVALATEKNHGSMLDEPPRRQEAAILSPNILILTVVASTLMCAGTLWMFARSLSGGDIVYARTIAFTTLSVFQLWNVFNMRSVKASLFSIGLFSNPIIFVAVIFSLGLQLAVLYLPALQRLFRTVPLGWHDWLLIAAVTSSIFFAVELFKLACRKGLVPRSWT